MEAKLCDKLRFWEGGRVEMDGEESKVNVEEAVADGDEGCRCAA